MGRWIRSSCKRAAGPNRTLIALNGRHRQSNGTPTEQQYHVHVHLYAEVLRQCIVLNHRFYSSIQHHESSSLVLWRRFGLLFSTCVSFKLLACHRSLSASSAQPLAELVKAPCSNANQPQFDSNQYQTDLRPPGHKKRWATLGACQSFFLVNELDLLLALCCRYEW